VARDDRDMTTTNYYATFISVAPDCPVSVAQEPPASAGKPSVAALQYELLARHPYEYTSDDVLFAVYARRAELAPERLDEERARFFARDQACFRASPLSKRYGWGTHHDEQGRIALIPIESDETQRLLADPSVVTKAAMRSSRAK
jgi:hypothetical protein